ncbi:MAG: hypothetical protein WDM77_00255 [Steroidobacteraceae bacterium]
MLSISGNRPAAAAAIALLLGLTLSWATPCPNGPFGRVGPALR